MLQNRSGMLGYFAVQHLIDFAPFTCNSCKTNLALVTATWVLAPQFEALRGSMPPSGEYEGSSSVKGHTHIFSPIY